MKRESNKISAKERRQALKDRIKQRAKDRDAGFKGVFDLSDYENVHFFNPSFCWLL